MKITYDPDVDAMYIQLIDGKHECRTVCLTDEIALDFGRGEKLVGIEILDARKIVGRGKLPRIVVDNIAASGRPAAPRRIEKIHAKAASKSRRIQKKAA